MRFEWDAEKAASNLAKHNVSFDEGATVFGDILAETIFDPDHSTAEEPHWLTIGLSDRRRLLVIWHVDRGKATRIIGARAATLSERRTYESGT